MTVLLDSQRSRASDLDEGWPTRHPFDRMTIVLVFAAFPIALIGDLGGLNLGSAAWLAVLVFGLLGMSLVPMQSALWRSLSMFVIFMAYGVASLLWTIDFAEGVKFLAQTAAVGVAYVAGWRAAIRDDALVAKLRRWAPWLMPAGLIVFFNAAIDGASIFGWIRGGNVARPMVMMLALLFLLGSVGRSRRFAIALWAGALLLAFASGGRMGMAVMGVMLILSPVLRWSWRRRLVLLGIGLLALTIAIQFDAVQDRLFLGRQEGELEDILTLERNFNTAGRSNNWPRIFEACSPGATFGHGAGSNRMLTWEATIGATPHPHNDFLRTYCDFGVAGSWFFWFFFLSVGVRGLRLYRHRLSSRIESETGAVAALTVLALLMFAATDNVIVYTSTFMAAAGVILGMSDATWERVRTQRFSSESPSGNLAGVR